MDAPPDYIIDRARRVALNSPCAKSKRGVVLYSPELAEEWEREHGRPIPEAELVHANGGGVLVAEGFNGPPEPMVCDGSLICKTECRYVCMHAEHRAIVLARGLFGTECDHLELVHVKVVGDQVVPGGGPSCWQCSREVLEAKLRGVWLYEEMPLKNWKARGDASRPLTPEWTFYTALEFHQATLAWCRANGFR